MTHRSVTFLSLALGWSALLVVSCGGSSDGGTGDDKAGAQSNQPSQPTPTDPSAGDGPSSAPSGPTGGDPASGSPGSATSPAVPDTSSPAPGNEASEQTSDAGAANPVETSRPPTGRPSNEQSADAGSSIPDELDGGAAEPVRECTDRCPVPRICMICGDGCAEAFVPCNPDGSCGEVQWLCDEETDDPRPRPEPGVGDCSVCPVTPICYQCEDGSCATPVVACNPDGSCGAVDWVCEQDGSGYDPCAGKAEGDTCTACPPGDADCVETGVIKSCQAGRCESARAR